MQHHPPKEPASDTFSGGCSRYKCRGFVFDKGQMACCYGQRLSGEVFRKLLLLHGGNKSWWILCTCKENQNLNLRDGCLVVWHLSLA